MVTPTTAVDLGQAPAEVLSLDVAQPEIVVETPPASALVTPAATESTPAVAPTPTPTPTPFRPQQPSEVEVLRGQLAAVEAEKQAQATDARLVAEARQVQREAAARGLSDEDALWVAERHYTVSKRVEQDRQQLQAEQGYLRAKQSAAILIARDHGVDANLLMTGNSPEEMVAIAEREKRYAAQDADIKLLKQRLVPAQSLDAANGSRAGSITANSDNIDKLWVDYEIAHPGNSNNPYEAAYRRFMGQ